MSKAGACKECGDKECDAEIGSYKDLKCKKDHQAHHIVPDYVLRMGTRPKYAKQKASTDNRMRHMPSLDRGMSICLKGHAAKTGTEHNIAHECDDVIYNISQNNTPKGTIKLGDVIQEAKKSAIRAKPNCEDEITKAIDLQFGRLDSDIGLRAIKRPPKDGWTEIVLEVFEGKRTVMTNMPGFQL